MLKDITLGQYFPGNSIIHRLDPRVKLVSTFVYIIFIFLAKSMLAFAFVLGVTAALVPLSRIKPRVIAKSLKPLMFVIVFTMALNLFFTRGEGEPLVSFWKINIYREGLVYAAYMILRIVCLLTGTSVMLTYTTSPIELTDGIEQLFAPLSKIHVPVHEFAMMMSTALRFIPTLIEETDKIMSAQKARGADFTTGSLVRRVKALFPVLIPLFVSAFGRADELAVAMECRCYRGGKGRTRMTRLRMSAHDYIFSAACAAVCAGIILLNIFTAGIGCGL